MEQTITINGVEYLLIPKENKNDNSNGNGSFYALQDFIGEAKEEQSSEDRSSESPSEMDKKTPANVHIIDASINSQVKEAVPKEYGYRERFIHHQLTPRDVIGKTNSNRGLIKDFQDIPEISSLDAGREPPKKAPYGFYGPGIEGDFI